MEIRGSPDACLSPRPPPRPSPRHRLSSMFVKCVGAVREVCNLYREFRDEFPTFEPESYLSSRSRDCLLRVFARPAVPSITRGVKRARARASAIDDSRYRTFRSPPLDPRNERYRNKICPRLPTGRVSRPSRFAGSINRKRNREQDTEREKEREREITRDTGRR